jgi:hypothetical protein
MTQGKVMEGVFGEQHSVCKLIHVLLTFEI